jgi:broad specificity phosphatase PhoE
VVKIYIARHGQDEDNAAGILNGHRDMPLTELGLGQARELAQHLKDQNILFDKIYSSPLKRAHRTAEIIAETLGLAAPEKHDLLIERNFGVMSGKLIADIEKLCAPDIIKAPIITYFLAPEGAELFQDLYARAQKALAHFQSSAEKTILLVCHGDIGKMIYGAFYDHGWKHMLTQIHFGNSELLVLDTDAHENKRHVFRQAQHNH